jgi:hypothetical protein
MRAGRRFRLGYAERSVVYHKVGSSIGTSDVGESSPLSDYYMTRNQLKFCWQYSKISIPFVLLNIARSIGRYVARRKFFRAAILVRALAGLPYIPKRK